MKQKTEIAIELFEQKNLKGALKIASEFRIGLTEEERKQIKRGYECMVHADFYKMIGMIPDDEIFKAIDLFKIRILLPFKERTA